ncbi:hypothetical protein B4U80_05363 [Leptotrombidium deliense]|uniref:Uncharacterized protein n=1 Tax=Leptotrombidium deliense TaxID=299467 RepID=A0A443S0S2_9ACAR|nr:hypothetical protein B4U80_05363 [Leptotrombidium deliense]
MERSWKHTNHKRNFAFDRISDCRIHFT